MLRNRLMVSLFTALMVALGDLGAVTTAMGDPGPSDSPAAAAERIDVQGALQQVKQMKALNRAGDDASAVVMPQH